MKEWGLWLGGKSTPKCPHCYLYQLCALNEILYAINWDYWLKSTYLMFMVLFPFPLSHLYSICRCSVNVNLSNANCIESNIFGNNGFINFRDGINLLILCFVSALTLHLHSIRMCNVSVMIIFIKLILNDFYCHWKRKKFIFLINK